ncbi:hypothetical protein H5410_033140 [Solanum commersonii]|uniref:CN hydrolase domain-containing protein n=1 Tax=Solanum commersonii TaxID=4109 RepID=A0A9J5YMU7_SOLCO|nr:hypothetical protein H5410_033140 [Solanum commersonii]
MPFCRYICLTWVSHCQEKFNLRNQTTFPQERSLQLLIQASYLKLYFYESYIRKLQSADFGRIGIGICHDIRFPELAMSYSARGAHLICYPGAFNMSTGATLWELEQRTRQDDSVSAVDNQLYVASCSPSQDSASSYMIWGYSTVVGPMGEIIATTEHEEAVLIAEIDYAAIQRTRESLPLESQKHNDIYQFVDLLRESPNS